MPIQVSIGLSTSSDHAKAVTQALDQASLNIDIDRISVCLVFACIEFSHQGVIRAINNYLGQVPVIGCSTLALMSDGQISKHGIAIMLLSLPEQIHINSACCKNISSRLPIESGQELGEKLLSGITDVRKHFALLFADGLAHGSSELIPGLQERLGISFPLVGALASDNLSFQRTYQYINKEIVSDSACAILWSGKLNFGLGIKHGWKPLGKPHRVTKALGNIVYEIDGAPAVRIYEDYFAKTTRELNSYLKHISVLYPLGIYLSGEEEYLLRNILSIRKDGSLLLQGNIPEDSQIRLMIATKESCLEATMQAVAEVKRELASQDISFALVFNSASRYMLLGRQAKKEAEIIRDGLGSNIPTIGIYTYGEYGPLRAMNYLGRTYLHNQTVTILAVAG
jgi:hypothetical protein